MGDLVRGHLVYLKIGFITNSEGYYCWNICGRMTQPLNKTLVSEGSIVPRISEDHTNSLKQSVLETFAHEKYSHLNNQPKLKIFFFEFIGMTLFLGLALSAKQAQWADIYIGVGVLTGVIFSGPVSGANLNPAVTLCNVIKKEDKFRLKMLPVYWLAQFFGALIAIMYCQLTDDVRVGPLMPAQHDAVSCLRVVASQMFGSFILVFFILQISNPNTTFIDNELSGYMFIVVFVHTARKYAPSSHQCINSMIAFTFALVSAIEQSNAEGLLYCLLWVAGDLSGTIVAILFYEKLFQPNVEYMRKLKRYYQENAIQSLLEESLKESQDSDSNKKSGVVLKGERIEEIEVQD